jgi:hypothetical protein
VKFIPLALVFWSLAFSACTIFFPAVQEPVQPVAPKPVQESPAPVDKAFWDTAPSPDFLFFIGASAIRRDREESIRLALEDAARKTAMYHSLKGRYESRIDVGTGFLEYYADTASSLDYDEDYLKYTEELSYDPERDIVQWENSLFVRARYPLAGSGSGGIAWSAGGIPVGARDGRPAWVNAPPPDIPGYTYGVGLAGRRAYHRDTVNASCEAAAFSIMRNLSGRVKGGAADVQKSGAFGYSGAASASVSSVLSLRGFYVLDIWIDPSSKAAWTLALAREDFTGESEPEGK